MTGVCNPDCLHYGMPDAPPHREWRQVDTPAEPKPDNWIWRALYRLWLPAS